MSEQEPDPRHTPYGQSNPYGQPPTGEPSPYGQQPAYGTPAGGGDRRPGTVTAAAWITIAFAGIVTLLFAFTTLGLIVARDQVIAEMEKVPEFQEAGIDADAAVGVLVAVMLGLVVWSIIAIVLAVLVLRRSNVARILLVISSAVTALLALLTITSGISIVLLIAAIATIVLLFTGGAGDWFKRLPTHVGGYGGYPGGPYGTPPAGPYGGGASGTPYGSQPDQGSAPQYPPPSENPYGQPPTEGGSDHPPRDYPGR